MASWFQAGSGITINGSKLSRTSSGNGDWRTAYGAQEVTEGKHEWKIKLDQCQYNYVMIGVSSNTKYLESGPWGQQDTFCYLYCGGDGKIYHQGGGTAYSEAYKTGDTISVHLDLENARIEFSKNARRLGVCSLAVAADQKYRLTVCLHPTVGDKVDLVSYMNLSEEQKEETQVANKNYVKQYMEMITQQSAYLHDAFSNDKVQQLNVQQLNHANTYLSQLTDDIEKLEQELQQCRSKVTASQRAVKTYTDVDTSKYKQWTPKQIEIWLASLEDGRYESYVAKLMQGFKQDGIVAANLPELDQGDLRQFGMTNFNDRKALKVHLQKLGQQQNNKEGSSTGYM